VRATLGDTIFLVALTYGGAEDPRRSAAAGFNAHILKPAPVDHLASVIARRGAEALTSSDEALIAGAREAPYGARPCAKSHVKICEEAIAWMDASAAKHA